MSVDIRLPSITAKDPAGQIRQIQSYLYQTVQQLNWALDTISRTQEQATAVIKAVVREEGKNTPSPEATFSNIKELIIKSADIVNAYQDKMTESFNGLYTAKGEFGEFVKETNSSFKKTSDEYSVIFNSQETIQSNLESINGVLEIDSEKGTKILGTSAWVNIGVIGTDHDFPIYGIEVGQIESIDGELKSKKFAQYRSDGVYLYDQFENAVVVISQDKASFSNAEVRGVFRVGGFVWNGKAIKWSPG